MDVVLGIVSIALSISTIPYAGNHHDRLERIHGQLIQSGNAACIRNDRPVGCAGRIFLGATTKLNAWSHRGQIIVSPTLMDIANDDELAFVIAHEMAHNIRHNRKGGDAEIEADRMALGIAHDAGFNIEYSGSILLKCSTHGFSFGYPGTRHRVSLVNQEISRIRFAIDSGTSARPRLSRLPADTIKPTLPELDRAAPSNGFVTVDDESA